MASKQDIKVIFRALRAIYGLRWTTDDRECDIEYIAAMWLRVLADVDDVGLKRGMAKLERSPDGWPPTPGQFLALCTLTAEDLGIPNVQEAHRLACTERASHDMHPIVWHAQQQFGPWDLKQNPENVTFGRFKGLYEALVKRALAGEHFVYPEHIMRKIGPAPTVLMCRGSTHGLA